MDPGVPWTAAYAYNRFANAAAATSGFQTAEFQNTSLTGHQPSSTVQAQSTTNQLLLQAAATQLTQSAPFPTPSGFLPPPSVAGYDSVFSPLFHPQAKAHFAAAAAASRTAKQPADGDLTATLHQQAAAAAAAAYFGEGGGTNGGSANWHQGNSQLPSPFGVLPHESVVATSNVAPGKGGFVEGGFPSTQQFSSSGQSSQGKAREREIPPKSSTFENSPGFPANQQQQQSCIVSTSNNPNRAPQNVRTNQSVPATFNNQSAVRSEKPRAYAPPPPQSKPPQQIIQTKAQTKIYPEIDNRRVSQSTDLTSSQSSPISYAVNYQNKNCQQPARNNNTQNQYINQNFRFNSENEYAAVRKTGSADSAYSSGSNSGERRPSPLPSTSSGPTPAAYSSLYQSTSPLPRQQHVAYSSVITRAENRWTGQEAFSTPIKTAYAEEQPYFEQRNNKGGVKGRRKSGGEKAEEFTASRVPPVAHLGATVQPQNGYFDNERWTGTVHPSQSGSPNKHYVPQQLVHHTPSLSYFPPFHLQAGDYAVGGGSNETSFSVHAADSGSVTVKEENPRVFVPDVEEELKYLSQTAHMEVVAASQKNVTESAILPPPIKAPSKKLDETKSGFMTSYMKFLQGERDVSPPPACRSGRKATWSRNNKIYPPELIKPVVSAMEPKKGNEKPYHPAEERKPVLSTKNTPRRKLGSSDTDSEGERKRPKRKRGRAVKAPEPDSTTSELLLPRRELAKRRAKEKSNLQTLIQKTLNDEDEELDFIDSDTDPVWEPKAKVGDEEVEVKVKKKRRSTGRTKTYSSSEEDGKIGEKESAITGKKEIDNELIVNRSGEFVVMKSDLHEEYPPIWRIDGKTLLQKYEPFKENGVTLYRNISTYSGWTSHNKHIYVTVPVRYKTQNRGETVVELLKNEMTEMNLGDPELMARVMKDLEKYQDSFEVYVQTLISQSLDTNFLNEILQEQDEYFLSNVKTIDDVTEDHCQRLLKVCKWRPLLLNSLKMYPCLNLNQDLPKELEKRICAACDQPKASSKVVLYGQPYHPTTLETHQPDPRSITEKDFLVCPFCGWRVTLYNKATHQKYQIFIECAKRVAEKRTNSPNKDTTCILNELLADENWLAQLFLEVRTAWAEIEKIEHLSCESNKQLLQNAVAFAGIA